jgi:hypothetical protein
MQLWKERMIRVGTVEDLSSFFIREQPGTIELSQFFPDLAWGKAKFI